MRRLWVGLLTFVLLFSACTPVQPAETKTSNQTNQLTPLKLGVGYIPNVQFAVFYVGIEKGFYRAEGLDVSLDYGFENDYLKLVGTNQLSFMVGSGDQVVLGRAQGLPVRYIMRWYTRYPVVIFAKKSANITQPADLAGKKIGIPGPFGASYVAFRGILEAAGLKESDVTLESIGFTQIAAISTDKVDAAVDYSVNGPVALAQAGVETTQIKLDQYLKIPANGLVTNEATIQKQPALVQKMVQATQKSIQYTLDHPDEAFTITLKFVPEAGGDNSAVNRAIFTAVLDDWKTENDAQPGATSADEWQATAELMQRIGLVNTLVPTEELYTNQFLAPKQ